MLQNRAPPNDHYGFEHYEPPCVQGTAPRPRLLRPARVRDQPLSVSDPGSSVDDLQQHEARGPSQKTSPRRAACEWTAGETKLMLDYYKQYFPQVGPMKKFINNKEVFARISDNLSKTMGITRTGDHCCSRFKTVIRRKTSATVHNKKSGNSPSEVPYDEELAKIAALDDSVEPEELRDGYGVVPRNDTGSVSDKKGSSSGEAEETPDGSQIDEESQSSQSTQSSSSTGQTKTAERQKASPCVFPHQHCKI
ncbi:hypothetical protein HPB49_014520 [Dermacentor silvarum]|uniref:Uncharacterized protein n=1 Tax=Dermacentor silvarum TaxID=543639 RepID=A0ACB8DJ63_DERSI|nr:hypothetical protein HPB49_014520 [Dermacentor silvarum]